MPHADPLAGFTLHNIEHPDDPLFGPAYAMLDAHFGALGQLEDRADMARLLAAPQEHRGIWTVCPLVFLTDARGEAVAVGARYVAFEPATGVLGALDGSVYCAPAHRGAGLGPALVPLQLALARRLLAGFGAPRLVIELGDLEPVSPGDPDSQKRAKVWERAGYRLIPPAIFPLALVGMAAYAPPLPMWAIVRFPEENTPPAAISKALLHTLARLLDAAHAWAQDAGLATSTAALHRAIDAAEEDPVPLLTLAP